MPHYCWAVHPHGWPFHNHLLVGRRPRPCASVNISELCLTSWQWWMPPWLPWSSYCSYICVREGPDDLRMSWVDLCLAPVPSVLQRSLAQGNHEDLWYKQALELSIRMSRSSWRRCLEVQLIQRKYGGLGWVGLMTANIGAIWETFLALPQAHSSKWKQSTCKHNRGISAANCPNKSWRLVLDSWYILFICALWYKW